MLRFDSLVSYFKALEIYVPPSALSPLLYRFNLIFDRSASVYKAFERELTPTSVILLFLRFK